MVNDSLSDNHQLELFQELRKGGHIFGYKSHRDVWKGDSMEEMLVAEYKLYQAPRECVFNRLLDD